MVEWMKSRVKWVIVIAVLTVGAAGIANPDWVDKCNLVVLTLTLAVLIYYAADTHRIADQTAENALRPVVLRSGFLVAWDDVRQLLETQDSNTQRKPIQFTILKNIATDIQGYVVFNRRKHTLLFGSRISEIPQSDEARLTSPTAVTLHFALHWAWMKPDEVLLALPGTDSVSSDEENSLFIEYRDISGNAYFTKETKDFCQVCGKL